MCFFLGKIAPYPSSAIAYGWFTTEEEEEEEKKENSSNFYKSFFLLSRQFDERIVKNSQSKMRFQTLYNVYAQQRGRELLEEARKIEQFLWQQEEHESHSENEGSVEDQVSGAGSQ